jgi:para-aminobenzoate synthetase component I
MRPLVNEISSPHTPESLAGRIRGEPGLVLLRSASFDSPQARYSFVTARPFLTFRSFGSRCEIEAAGGGPHPRSCEFVPLPGQERRLKRTELRVPTQVQFGNPWHLLDALMSRYELLDEIDRPFPLGGCFGYWGYDLKNFVEPKLPRRAGNDLELPDCQLGFYDSLVVFDHRLDKTWIVSTGLDADGSRGEHRARERLDYWQTLLTTDPERTLTPALSLCERERVNLIQRPASSNALGQCDTQERFLPLPGERAGVRTGIVSNLSKDEFVSRVQRAQRYIRAGDIYQVNLSQRLTAECPWWDEASDEPDPARPGNGTAARGDTRPTRRQSGWELFQRLSAVSPAPFLAFLDCADARRPGRFQIASSSPELFLRLSGSHIQTRPIKGTRPRSADPTRDAQLAYELQTSAKEMAELVMITDLLRNDLGRVCEFGSVHVPELARLERFAQVQHLVSSVEGRLRSSLTHLAAFAACFPGGSITGAPKFRAMEIIDELEPLSRGPYTGALGYIGFNRESQLSIIIRAAICQDGCAHFHVGAGIVADSNPDAEYEETLAKAGGFLAALNQPRTPTDRKQADRARLKSQPTS